MPRKLVPKTRNDGTMTEAAFRGWVRSQLRRMSQKWRPISGVMMDCRRKATAEDKAKWGNRITYVHQCASCKEWFPRKMMTVDHIEPCGSLMDIEKDAGPFILRLLVERDGLQPLDNECHDAKTKQDRSGT